MIAGVVVSVLALAFGAPVERPVLVIRPDRAAVSQEVDTAAHGAQARYVGTASGASAEPADEEQDTHGAQESHPSGEPEQGGEWGTETMVHHIADSNTLEVGPMQVDLDRVRIPPIRVAGIEIDLSPTKHVVFLALASLLTIFTIGLASRNARRTERGETAPRGIHNLFEAFYIYLRDDVALANIGHGGERYVPYVVTLFFFVLYANLLGLLPHGASATGNISVTGALAIVSLIVIEVAGFRTLGPKGYLGTIFFIPKGVPAVMKGVMLVIMTPVELIGKLAKPFALAVRLFANMTAGHFVLLSLIGLILVYGGLSVKGLAAVSGSLGLGLFVMFLEVFVALLQAYIFTALTAVFIGLIRHAH